MREAHEIGPQPPLERRLEEPRSDRLVFTSAGDRGRVEQWAEEGRDPRLRGFDLWVVEYGDRPGRYRGAADYWLARPGYKFPNLHHVVQRWRPVIERYRMVAVLDDDLVVGAAGIRRLFATVEARGLWVAQPAFLPQGRISHPITERDRSAFLRYTSFVEVSAPVFRTEALLRFLEQYEPAVAAWGIDFWFCQMLHSLPSSTPPERRFAVVDGVPCINPWSADGRRECDRVYSTAERIAQWLEAAARRGLDRTWPRTVYGSETTPPDLLRGPATREVR